MPSDATLPESYLAAVWRISTSPRELFAPNPCADSFAGVRKYWELRRPIYNAILLPIGIVSTIIYWTLLDKYAVPSSDDGIFPGPMPIFIGIAANVFYTSGWLVESLLLLLRRHGSIRFGPILFTTGLMFSMLLIAFPGGIAIELTHKMHKAHQSHRPTDPEDPEQIENAPANR
jgi:hypothetical protein